MCSMWSDGYNAIQKHIARRAAFVVVGKADISKLRAVVRDRGWTNLRFLSSEGSSFNADFEMETPDGSGQFPGISVFTRDADGTIRHRYTQWAFFPGTDLYRGLDLLSPVWNMLDLTPDGRGDWMPSNDQA